MQPIIFQSIGTYDASKNLSNKEELPSHFIARAKLPAHVDRNQAHVLRHELARRFEQLSSLSVVYDLTAGCFFLQDTQQCSTRQDADKQAEKLSVFAKRYQYPRLRLLEAVVSGKRPEPDAYADFMRDMKDYSTGDKFLQVLEKDKGGGAVTACLKRNCHASRGKIKLEGYEKRLLKHLNVAKPQDRMNRRNFLAAAGVAALAAGRGGQNHFDRQALAHESARLSGEERDAFRQQYSFNPSPGIERRLEKIIEERENAEWWRDFKGGERWVDAAVAGGAAAAAAPALKNCIAPYRYTEAQKQLSQYFEYLFKDFPQQRGIVRG